MRIKNKEIRQRRHRKEQTIKSAQRETRAKYSGEAKPAPAPAPAPAKKPAAKKPADAAKKPAPKPKKADA
ncbi:MAG TPA: hypothetical protein VKT78_07330 [Fimbriimonadaceae bacterium]|nr:hypothetical protein [Fimbriimonadaceae bacterium]